MSEPDHESTFLNGGVQIEEKDGDTAEVTHICVGCGKEIRTFDIFTDRIEASLGIKPLHDSLECRREGEKAMEVEA